MLMLLLSSRRTPEGFLATRAVMARLHVDQTRKTITSGQPRCGSVLVVSGQLSRICEAVVVLGWTAARVLAILYLIFNEGYLASDAPRRPCRTGR
jgi:hypothetical protein